MIVADVNLLMYAYDSSSPHHDAAAEWWKGCMTGGEEIGLAAVVVFGFVRLTTDAQIAALTRQEKAVLHSNDTDFLRFPGIRWHNPLTGKSNAT